MFLRMRHLATRLQQEKQRSRIVIRAAHILGVWKVLIGAKHTYVDGR